MSGDEEDVEMDGKEEDEEDEHDHDHGDCDSCDGHDHDQDHDEEEEEEEPSPDLHITHSGSPSADLTLLLHLLHMDRQTVKSILSSPESLFQFREQLQSGGWTVSSSSTSSPSISPSPAISTPSPITQAVLLQTAELARKKLEAYPTTLEEDREMLKKVEKEGEGDVPLRWALILRIGEKVALERAVGKVVKRGGGCCDHC
ncbi:hypothetical protein HK097_003881 [Rhizophlyctis rosea]|uniref:Rubisco LSMT substrate-binding domain-containing protein n=1 Tax=Rhizophlyctis rosea TaxID=64517 RepID=A0AAD5WZB8_9FUNG|nr:hypothetical protein HK097_003881 [Rhizophlyctis rosea]